MISKYLWLTDFFLWQDLLLWPLSATKIQNYYFFQLTSFVLTKINVCVKFGFQRVKLKSYSIIMKKKVKNEKKKNFMKLSRFWPLRG